MAIKMAIIGYGGMGNWHHENIKKSVPEIQVVGAYDIRPEQAAKMAENGIHCYKTAQELYDDPAIDLVLVSTPNDFHKGYAIAALRAGKNVMSEKPVTLNAHELEEIIAVSRETGKLFTIHQNRRWDSDFLTIRKILDDGILENPYIIESRIQGSRGGLYGWRGYKQNGGGMVLDWGIHILDQAMWLFKDHKVVSVVAHLHQVYAPEVDDNFLAMIRFDNGVSYLLNVAMNCFILQPRWHMSCEDGTAVITNWEMDGKIVKLADDAAMDWTEDIVYTAAGPTRSMVPRPKETTKELELPKVIGDSLDLHRNVAAAIQGKAELIVKPEQSLRVMRVIDLFFRSSETGEAIKCEI